MTIQEHHPQQGSKFLGNNGEIILLGLFTAALFSGVIVWGLPPIVNLVAFIAVELIFAGSIIWVSSRMSQWSMISRQSDATMNTISGKTDNTLGIAIPSLRFFLIRGAITFMGILFIWILIWGGVFGSIFLSMSLTEDANEQTSRGIGLLVGGFFGIVAIYLSVVVINIVIAIVDRYIYPNESIQQIFYTPEDNPLDWRKLIKTVGWIFLSAGLLVLVGLARVLINSSDSDLLNREVPSWVNLLCLVLPFIFIGWWVRSVTGSHDKTYEKISKAVEVEYGYNSKEHQEFELFRERQAHSIEDQARSQAFRYFFAMLGLLFIVFIGASFIIRQVDGLQQHGEGIGAGILLVGIVAILWGLSKSSKWMNIQVPEEMQQIQTALEAGDYKAAKTYADSLYRKLPPAEGNFAVALAYGESGDTKRGREFAQEGLSEQMARDKDHRNNQAIANFLWLMAGMHNADGEYEQAFELIQRALEFNPNEMAIYHQWADNLLQQKKSPELALQYLNKVFELNAQRPTAQQSKLIGASMLKAWALTELKDHATAKALMQETFNRMDKNNKPMAADAYYVAGRIAVSRGAYTSAEEFFKRSLAVDANGLTARHVQKMLDRLAHQQ